MKNLFFAVLISIVVLEANAQIDSTRTTTKLETFQSRRNKLFQKEWIEIGKVRNALTVQLITITDLTEGDKISGLSISWYANYSSYNGFLDIDEVEDLLKSVVRMTTFVLSPPPQNYTEIIFQSKEFYVGIFPNNQNKTVWKAIVKDPNYPRSSSAFINAEDLSKLQALLTIAKDRLQKLK